MKVREDIRPEGVRVVLDYQRLARKDVRCHQGRGEKELDEHHGIYVSTAAGDGLDKSIDAKLIRSSNPRDDLV
jgi:hypothetical protein